MKTTNMGQFDPQHDKKESADTEEHDILTSRTGFLWPRVTH